MKKPKLPGGSKGSYVPSVELKGLGASKMTKPSVAIKKKGTLASALAKVR